tara:strand:+ start:321 stop:554 length:234 start_codon:yes stop_codon:yes gene_type:complete
MIIERKDDDKWVDEFRPGELAVIVNTAEGVRLSPYPVGLYMKFIPGWEDIGHDDEMVDLLMSLYPETKSARYNDIDG